MEIPCDFFTQAWLDAKHPMAAVALDNTFVRVNHAFEDMLGYSTIELKGRPWMDFTKHDHVGGDLASVNAVLKGEIESYRLEKTYINKQEDYVDVVLTVRRYPPESHKQMLLFSVEAPVAIASKKDIQSQMDDLRREQALKFEKVIEQVKKNQDRLASQLASQVVMHVNDADGVQVGGEANKQIHKTADKATTNHTLLIVVVGLCVVITLMGVFIIVNMR